MHGQPFFTFTLNCFSKSTCVGFLRNFSSKTSLIAFTKCCKHSNVVLSLTLQYSLQSVNSLAICKHAHCTCAFLDGAQSDNTTCISLLYKIAIICIDVIHDAKEQCVMHLILTMKKLIVIDWMFCKIISHNSVVVDFGLRLGKDPPCCLLAYCCKFGICYIKATNTINCNFIF